MFEMWSDLGEEPITAQGAQSKRPQPDAPVQQPMRAGLKPAQQRKPSADQKRIRRQMAKNAHTTSSTTPTKESNAMTQHTEQDLIARLASATSMAEQTDLQNQIEAIRATRRDTIAMEGSLDWDAMGEMPPSRMQAAASHLFSGGSIEDLPPATASTRLGHTEGTDWLMDVTADVTPDATLSAVARSEATLWFTNLWDAVKQDRQEFTAQAHNAAASSGSQFGLQATAGKAVFLDQVKHLASREGITLIADMACRQTDQHKEQMADSGECSYCGETDPYFDHMASTSSVTAAEDGNWVPLTGSELRAYLSGETKDEGIKMIDGKAHKRATAGRAFLALQETVDTYVSDGKTTQPVGVGASDNMDSFSEWTIGTDLNHDDPKSTDAGTPSLAEGDTPEGDKAEGVDNPNYGVGPDKSEWAVGNTDDKMATQGGLRMRLSVRHTAISLTNVGIDGENGVGTTPDGTRVTFRLTPKELADLKSVLYSDLAGNFSGVDIEESDIIKGASVHTASLADRMAAEFGNSRTAGIQTFTPHFAQEEQSGTADGLSSADAASEAPSMKEGDAPETGHQESFTQTPGEGAQDLSGPTDSDRPGGGVEWGTSAARTAKKEVSRKNIKDGAGNDAIQITYDDGTTFTMQADPTGDTIKGEDMPFSSSLHSLAAISRAFEGKPVSSAVATLAASLRTVGSIHEAIGDTPVRVIATALANSPEVPTNVKQALRQHLASATCSVCGDAIAKDPSSEDPSTYHHDNGEKHDHEAKPGSEFKEGQRAPFGRESKQAAGYNVEFGPQDSAEGAKFYVYRHDHAGTGIEVGGPYDTPEQAESEMESLRSAYRGTSTLNPNPGYWLVEERGTVRRPMYPKYATKQASGYGWPMGPNPNFPGEQMIVCPQDGGPVMMEGYHGPSGRAGMPGGGTTLRCKTCGFNQSFPNDSTATDLAGFMGSVKTAGREIQTDGGGRRYVMDKRDGMEFRYFSDGSVTILDSSKKSGTNGTIGHTGPNPEKVPAEFKTASRKTAGTKAEPTPESIKDVGNGRLGERGTCKNCGKGVSKGVAQRTSGWVHSSGSKWCPEDFGKSSSLLSTIAANIDKVAFDWPGAGRWVKSEAVTGEDVAKSSQSGPDGEKREGYVWVEYDQSAKEAAGKGNDFSLSDAKNDEGEWVMSPEQIRAEMGYDPSEDEGDPYHEGSKKVALDDAGLGVGHIWYEQRCPAYTTLNGADCTCDNAPGAGTRQSAKQADKTAMPNPVENGVDVGAIFYSSWGYDQTNVDFYEVVGVTGASVKIIPIDKRVVEGDGSPSEQVMPVKGSGAGLPQTKRLNVSGTSIYLSLNSFSNAYLWDGKPKNQTGYGYGH